jgi:MvdC family ATP-grasp ribosomal peptide maturase
MNHRHGAVLILTHSADHFTVENVEQALARRGVGSFRLESDRFPAEVRLSARLGPDGSRHWIEDGSAEIESQDVRAVWFRRIWSPRLDEALDPGFREACGRESLASLYAFLDGFCPTRWINDPARNQAASVKARQLRLARESGLSVPRTLITNDPRRARAFYDEMDGIVVAKLLTGISQRMEGPAPAVPTSSVRREDLDDLEALRHCPMVFQERIRKEVELRVMYVEGRLFTGSIDARLSAGGAIDWRGATPEECQWRLDSVPEDVARSLKALMRALGLASGAIDLIRTPSGEHLFLEVNPTGEWGMLERDLDLPISEALAEALLSDGGGLS